MSTLFFYCLWAIPLVIFGAIGELLAIALGFIDPWDMR